MIRANELFEHTSTQLERCRDAISDMLARGGDFAKFAPETAKDRQSLSDLIRLVTYIYHDIQDAEGINERSDRKFLQDEINHGELVVKKSCDYYDEMINSAESPIEEGMPGE